MRYGFSEYFKKRDANKPYKNRQEELKDYLSLVDVLLENYMDIIMEHEEGLVFHRGVPMTAEQIEIIYEQEPGERGIDRLDDETIETAEKAFSYIGGRYKATPENTFLPIRSLIKRFDLSDFEKFCLIFSIATEENLTYGRMLGFLVQNKSGHMATYGAVLVIYEALYGENCKRVYDDKKMDTFFFLPDKDKSIPGMRYFRTMQLYFAMREYIFGNGEALVKRLSFKDEDKEVVFFDEEVERLCNIKKEEPLQIFMESKDAEDVLYILSVAGKKKNEPIYLLDEADFEEDGYVEKLITASLYKGIVALHINRVQEALSPEHREIVTRTEAEHRESIKKALETIRSYLPAGEIFIYGPERMPEKEIPDEMSPLIFSVPLPGMDTRKKIWEYFIKKYGITLSEDISLDDLSDCYRFSFGMIRSVIRRAKLQMSDSFEKKKGKLTKDILLPVLFRRNDANFGALATFIPAAYTWDDIEMDERERNVLKTACNRYRLRGRLDKAYGIADKNAYGNGVSVLLYGPPGTGKTMAARVISNELSLPLYRVDVSRIFSKYIGETEKNLSAIFEEAEKSNVILFFDEADALFTKRTDISDANDKHANAQTAFLLQKIEEYPGITLLATNLYHNFDTAFIRRITYVSRLDAPDAATRKRLWLNTLPKSVPMENDIDFDFLSERFEISGANIKSILMSAAYMAGAEGVPVSASHIIKAMRYEFVKLGRIIDPAEFGKYVMYV
ncbi:MAG: ATP-binding protein [Lachnospiraceae bacterium]|nr:ATP-binding protein [Lachnospiraceae bacterium]